jgi:fluoride exporter
MARRGTPDSPDSHSELPLDPDPGPLTVGLIVLVGIGGALGTAARYGLARWLPAGAGLPRGTLIANLVGAVILGVLVEALARRGPDLGSLRRARLLIGTGFCGGLTTFSTLAVETDLLIRAHRDGLAAGYAVGSILAGVALAGLGIAAAARLHRRTT